MATKNRPRALVRKLSTASLIGKIVLEDGEVERELYSVGGVASEIQTGEGTFGPWTALLGKFSALVPGDEKQYVSSKLFIPEPALSLIATQLKRLQSSGAEGGVEFAFTVKVQADENSATGYVYIAESLIEPEESDSMQKLLTVMESKSSNVKALPSPGNSTVKKTAGKK